LASPTKLTPNHLIPHVFVLCYSLISATYRPQYKTSTADTEIYQAQPQSIYYGTRSRYKGIIRVPSSAGEEPDSGRTVKRFRCPLRLLYLLGTSFHSERSPRCQMAICRPRRLVRRLLIRKRQSAYPLSFIDCAAPFSSAIFTRLGSWVSGSKKVAVILTFCRRARKVVFACVDGPGH
jgi:hypothetical protein